MNLEHIYRALSKIAWAYVLLHANLNLGTLNVLPNWAGYLLLWQAIALLGGEVRDLLLLKPFCILLGAWEGAAWLLALAGRTLDGLFLPLDLLVAVISLYFHFQLLTDVALLAEDGGEGSHWARRLRIWRSVNAVLSTALSLVLLLQRGSPLPLTLLLGFAGLITVFYLMYCLFSLRRLYLPTEEEEPPAL